MQERIYIKTFGCQMNEYESLRIRKLLEKHGFSSVNSYHDASLIMLNTCTVRQKAEDKIYSELGRIHRLKRDRPDLLIGVGGCLAQQEGKRLLNKYPYINFVFGTRSLARLPVLIARVREGMRITDTDMEMPDDFYAQHAYTPDHGQISAYVTIMQGCDNYCSYCIVPYVRGRAWSRTPQEILTEIENLVRSGVREVTLLGQNVNSYGRGLKQTVTFASLLRQIDAIRGLERIRFTTSHPRDLSKDLISAFGSLAKLCEHIHLPMQSGSDRILQDMNRHYTREQYLNKIQQLRSVLPSISVTSDIIVGYPGETDTEFNETVKTVEQIEFDDLFIFHYTDRKGTQSSEMHDNVPYPVKIERLKVLNDIQREICIKKNTTYVKKNVEVLFENHSKKGSGYIAGRTRSCRVVNCKGPETLIGKIGWVTIDKANIHSLSGKLVERKLI